MDLESRTLYEIPESNLVVHHGARAHNTGTLQKILHRLSALDPAINSIDARFVHLMQCQRTLTASEFAVVEQLLDYGESVEFHPQRASQFTIVPRLGTISPWSSKATDVFLLCGLDAVARIERGVQWFFDVDNIEVTTILVDRMTESVIGADEYPLVFSEKEPRLLTSVDISRSPIQQLQRISTELGLALSDDEIGYLVDIYRQLDRDPTDVELMMFAQANSEHCRHKIFNASWICDGKLSNQSLFQKIRITSAKINNQNLLSAYKDNAAVIKGSPVGRFQPDIDSSVYGLKEGSIDILMKVETHNHPTCISPYPGAATGSGGEIRDEGSVGSGSKPKTGLVGFTTSHLRIPDDPQLWESPLKKPDRIATALEIMLEGPIGAAGYNNEFGRPAICGYFRTFEEQISPTQSWGFHKPIMIAGGLGSIQREHVHVTNSAASTYLVLLGGPAMLIGLGGGSSSSMNLGDSAENLDYASVQRDNAELQRRCQEVIDRCTSMGKNNPITLIHDVGAGGLSNAVPELLHELGHGISIDLQDIPRADKSLSPLEVWCNESQERYVLAIEIELLGEFEKICARERCPYAVLSRSQPGTQIQVRDSAKQTTPIDLPLEVILGKPPKMVRTYVHHDQHVERTRYDDLDLSECIERVLRFPAVGSKKFLITIGDRSITGLIAQEQMVGPYQVPVADASITLAGFDTYRGEVMAMGERSPIATVDAAASARTAIAEALTNLCSVRFTSLQEVVLSANWMAAAGQDRQDTCLYDAVEAASHLCQDLGIAIPVGKDSLSMMTKWSNDSEDYSVVSPVSLIASAFGPVADVRNAKTPQLVKAGSSLMLIELSSLRRLGGSVVSQVFTRTDTSMPDVDEPQTLLNLIELLQDLHDRSCILSMHDRSDGGLFTTVLEMAIAGRKGVDLFIHDSLVEELFNEEIGVVIEISSERMQTIEEICQNRGLVGTRIGQVISAKSLKILNKDEIIFERTLTDLEKTWAHTSYLMQRLRDNPASADSEFELIDKVDPGLDEQLTFAIDQYRRTSNSSIERPRVAILRDQGVNGQLEMAAAFHFADFESVDVHMTDLFAGRVSLEQFQVLAVCGGFSYGDVLGAGGGWAKSILFHDVVREEFARFFARDDTLTLGVCNGCQMLSRLHTIISSAEHWPTYEQNSSTRFEARTIQVKVEKTNSPWLHDMVGSQIPIPVAHGEGRAVLSDKDVEALISQKQVAFTYVDGFGDSTNIYPMNPNGSTRAIAGNISADGRVLLMMPHPERVFRTIQNSWVKPEHREREFSPWFQLFRNARKIF